MFSATINFIEIIKLFGATIGFHIGCHVGETRWILNSHSGGKVKELK